MASLSELNAKIKTAFTRSNKSMVTSEDTTKIYRQTSGVTKIDKILGGNDELGWGIPKGRMIELFSLESGAKSSFCLSVCAQFQKQKKVCIYLDLERTFDSQYAKNVFGLEINDYFQVYRPGNSEQTLTLLQMLYDNADQIDLIILDSTAAVIPSISGEYDPKSDSRRPGSQATAVQDIIWKYISLFSTRWDTTMICISQTRANIITNGYDSFANNSGTGAGAVNKDTRTTTGGTSPRFYASIRLRLDYAGKLSGTIVNPITGAIEESKDGFKLRITGVKNKTGAPFLRGEVNFYYTSHTLMAGIKNNLNDEKVYDFAKFPLSLEELTESLENPQFTKLVSHGGFDNSADMLEVADEDMHLFSQSFNGSRQKPLTFKPNDGKILEEEWDKFIENQSLPDDCWFAFKDGALEFYGPAKQLKLLASYHPVFVRTMDRIVRESKNLLEELTEEEAETLNIGQKTAEELNKANRKAKESAQEEATLTINV